MFTIMSNLNFALQILVAYFELFKTIIKYCFSEYFLRYKA